MCRMPPSDARLSSIRRVTSVSSVPGVAPGKPAVTMMAGNSRSARFCTVTRLKPITTDAQSRTNNRIEGMGLRMAHAEKFMRLLSRGGLNRHRRGLGRVDHANGISLRQEAAARQDDFIPGGEA